MKKIDLYPHQLAALDELKTGSILVDGVGSGKSRTALAYFYKTGYVQNKMLYIITTAKKRDSNDWIDESIIFDFTCPITVDSWNNIEKYEKVKNQFFIFDEQRVVGSGKWAKTFIKIAKNNNIF